MQPNQFDNPTSDQLAARNQMVDGIPMTYIQNGNQIPNQAINQPVYYTYASEATMHSQPIYPNLANNPPFPAAGAYQAKGKLEVAPGILVNKVCQACGKVANLRAEKKKGKAFIGWTVTLVCICLYCAWIPLVMDDCYDYRYYCVSCGHPRAVVQSDYCCC